MLILDQLMTGRKEIRLTEASSGAWRASHFKQMCCAVGATTREEDGKNDNLQLKAAWGERICNGAVSVSARVSGDGGREVNKAAEKLEGRDGVKMSGELFDTSAAAGSASHAILRGFTDVHYFTCPAVTQPETKNTHRHTHTLSLEHVTRSHVQSASVCLRFCGAWRLFLQIFPLRCCLCSSSVRS